MASRGGEGAGDQGGLIWRRLVSPAHVGIVAACLSSLVRGECIGVAASAEPGGNRPACRAPTMPGGGSEAVGCLPSLSRECRNQAGGVVSRLLGRTRGTGRGGTGRGFQPAMVRAQARACAVSVMAGNSRRSSTAAENSPLCS